MTTNEPFGVPAPRHRLPEGTRVGPVRLQVSDLDRSLDWYGNVLGLQAASRQPGAASLAAGDELVSLRELTDARPIPRRGRLGVFHFALLVPDRAALGRFARHLADTGTPFGASDHRVSEALYLRDPDGFGIEVYADRPRRDWRSRSTDAGRELVMGTEPLDLDGLAAVAGNAAWEGMPAGTTMGHVHLHVGQLEVARDFYHAALGLDLVVWSYPGALFLSAGGYHHHLGVNTWAGPDAVPPAARDARLLEWTLLVPEGAADLAAQSLASSGHAVARDHDSGFAVADPWGTRLRVRTTS